MKYSNDSVIEALNKYFKIKDIKPTKIKNRLEVNCCIDENNKSTIMLINKHILRLTDGHSGRMFSIDLRIVKHSWVFCLSRWLVKFFIETGSYNMPEIYNHNKLLRLQIEYCGNLSEVIMYYGFNGILYNE